MLSFLQAEVACDKATCDITSKRHSGKEDTKQIQTLFTQVKIVARAIRRLSDRVNDDNIARVHQAFALLEDAFQGSDKLHLGEFVDYVDSTTRMFEPRRQAVLEVTNVQMIRHNLCRVKSLKRPPQCHHKSPHIWASENHYEACV
jgi:hypothetical protein